MATYTIQDLFEEYVFQRQQNVRTEQVLQLLMQMKPDMTRDERRELSQWIRDWERQQQEPPPPPSPPPKEVEKTDPVTVVDEVVCPHCQKRNPFLSKYCYSCGELLTGGIPSATDRLYEEVDDPATFGAFSTLMVIVFGYEQQPIRIKIGDTAIMIGRSDPDSPFVPEIDLAPYGAKAQGVSRQHAILKRAQNTLTLSDHSSVNFTFVNGEKLQPHEVRVIRDGDEVRFGRLNTRFVFHRELRRLLS